MVKEFAFKRVHAGIKALLREGIFYPGEKIDVNLFADKLSVSATPVRQVLFWLCGERLVETTTGEGFYVARVTEASMRHLYEWHLANGRSCLNLIRPKDGATFPSALVSTAGSPDLVLSIEKLFMLIAKATRNAEYERDISNANDRLHLARRLKNDLIEDRNEEFEGLNTLWCAGRISELSDALAVYTDRRLEIIPDMVELLQRKPLPHDQDKTNT